MKRILMDILMVSTIVVLVCLTIQSSQELMETLCTAGSLYQLLKFFIKKDSESDTPSESL